MKREIDSENDIYFEGVDRTCGSILWIWEKPDVFAINFISMDDLSFDYIILSIKVHRWICIKS